MSLLVVIVITLISNSTVKRIKEAVRSLREKAVQINSAVGQISTDCRQLSDGASEQAAAIEQTSSSLQEMSAMTRRNAEHADQSNKLMTETTEIFPKANRSMDQLTTSMNEISRASEKTSKIIKTIDEIAFQTNLLALNAAVEAARAGEAGAGFAVVAAEVRDLAMRAAEAARNTADLIETTVGKIKDGAEIVQASGVEFAQAIVDGSPSPVPAEQSLQVMTILDAVYRSEKSGGEIKLK